MVNQSSLYWDMHTKPFFIKWICSMGAYPWISIVSSGFWISWGKGIHFLLRGRWWHSDIGERSQEHSCSNQTSHCSVRDWVRIVEGPERWSSDVPVCLTICIPEQLAVLSTLGTKQGFYLVDPQLGPEMASARCLRTVRPLRGIHTTHWYHLFSLHRHLHTNTHPWC